MSETSALIFPSIWYEGMPMTIIESLSVGTPVIASNLGAMASMIKDNINGLLFEPNDSNSLRQKLSSWSRLSENELNKKRDAAHNSFVENYNHLKNFKMLIDIYEGVYLR